MLGNHNATVQRRMEMLRGDPFVVDRFHRPEEAPATKLRFPDAIRAVDPHFSGALFRDYALLVYARAIALQTDRSGSGMLQTLLTDRAIERLRSSLLGWSNIGLVTIGHHTVEVVERNGARMLEVCFFSNITVEPPAGGGEVLLEREERWVFGRPKGATSPRPERLQSLGCVNCGSTEDPGLTGACPSCQAPRTEGALHWRVVELEVLFSERAPSPELPLGGGKEPGLDNPTIRHPGLRKRRARFLALHPTLDLGAELTRLGRMFVQLQEAWTRDHWEEARPLMSDALFTANQGWLEQLKRAGYRNRTVGVKVERIELCDIDVDKWVETVTVRIFASCLDWTERLDNQALVGGSAKVRREFSEYWTFMRSIGARRKTDSLLECPSCGAPLDKMAMTGVCGYCESKVTAGRFDWVATRISQDDDVV